MHPTKAMSSSFWHKPGFFSLLGPSYVLGELVFFAPGACALPIRTTPSICARSACEKDKKAWGGPCRGGHGLPNANKR